MALLKSISNDTISIICNAISAVKSFRIKYETKRIMKRSQLRAARALLSWSQEQLAEESGVSVATVKRLEPGEGSLQTKVETMEKLQRALEGAGVEFISENGGGAGVRLKERSETVADLTGQIDVLKADMTPEPDNEKPSPKRGMKQLRRAHDLNELVDLKNRRAKVRKEEKE